ncbi:histidine phosphatase family protein [Polynucleobacter sp. HIN5]|uniref:histidine phosphatase family protein n=1 Tax=Polynucleobacter sp. HIN5 TaxID=3047864 RepID=UPI002573AA3E|nr:histidine phosphatase family protein [Polynucleobacter sp. HIN5]BEI33403.1 histidine phosphatase family protein [Polynucleobacter sp. HIN5]
MKRLLLVLLGVFCIPPVANANLLSELQSGSTLIVMRHADAPGIGDPSGYRLGDCSTQRNLGEHGRQQAKEIGAWLSKQGIGEARVFSSPWCRCLDTAVLLNKGLVTSERSLGSFFNEMSDSGKQTRELEAFVRQQLSKSNKLPLILVTHQVNTHAYTGMSVGVGQMLLVKVNAQGKAISSRALN